MGFSSWGGWELLSSSRAQALRSMDSVTAASALSSCGSRPKLLCYGMWDLPGSGIEPMSPVLAGRFLTTAPAGKSCPPCPKFLLILSHVLLLLRMTDFCLSVFLCRCIITRERGCWDFISSRRTYRTFWILSLKNFFTPYFSSSNISPYTIICAQYK